MRILLLGGTVFLGPALVDAATARGHSVTLFHRGKHAVPAAHAAAAAAAGVEVLTGDRNVAADLAALAEGRAWDAVIDTCGYFPRQVRASAAALRAHAASYVFISSISVYADRWTAADEDAPVAVHVPPLADDVATITGENYGPLKAACEDAARAAFGDGAILVRPGLIVGPLDPSDRYTYWVRRLARGGDVVAPGDGSRRVQIVDVRDLAEFVVGCLERRGDGGAAGAGDDGERGGSNSDGGSDARPGGHAFSVCGESMRFDAFLDTIRRGIALARAGAPVPTTVRWVPEDALLARGVAPWSDLPVWIAHQDQTTGIARAVAAGLRLRDPVETARATYEWDLTRDPSKPLLAGLTADREAEILRGTV